MPSPVYEMLWDCKFCGQKKLLGLTHRHCPNCGAQQDANARYFPPDAERVAVQDHRFVGADIVCRYCSAASSRAAHHCGNCGAPLVEGQSVQPLGEQSHALASPRQPSISPKRHFGVGLWVALKVLRGVLCLCGGGVLSSLTFWKKEAAFSVVRDEWSRTVNVETFGTVGDSICVVRPAACRCYGRAAPSRAALDQASPGRRGLQHAQSRQRRRHIPREQGVHAEAQGRAGFGRQMRPFASTRWHTERIVKAQGTAFQRERALAGHAARASPGQLRRLRARGRAQRDVHGRLSRHQSRHF